MLFEAGGWTGVAWDNCSLVHCGSMPVLLGAKSDSSGAGLYANLALVAVIVSCWLSVVVVVG